MAPNCLPEADFERHLTTSDDGCRRRAAVRCKFHGGNSLTDRGGGLVIGLILLRYPMCGRMEGVCSGDQYKASRSITAVPCDTLPFSSGNSTWWERECMSD